MLLISETLQVSCLNLFPAFKGYFSVIPSDLSRFIQFCYQPYFIQSGMRLTALRSGTSLGDVHKYSARPAGWKEGHPAWLSLRIAAYPAFRKPLSLRWLMPGVAGQNVFLWQSEYFAEGRCMWRKTEDVNWKPIIPIRWKLPVAIWEPFNRKCIVQKNFKI